MSVEDGGLRPIALLLTPKTSDMQLIAGILPPPIGLERLPNDLIVSTSRSFYFRLSVFLYVSPSPCVSASASISFSLSLCLVLSICLCMFMSVRLSLSVCLSHSCTLHSHAHLAKRFSYETNLKLKATSCVSSWSGSRRTQLPSTLP